DRFGRSEHPADADAVTRACVVTADGMTDAAPLVALAERSAAGTPTNPRVLTTLGAALSRAGRLEAAGQRLDEDHAPAAEAGQAPGGLFGAMAHARLGHPAEARQWLEKSAVWIDEALQRKSWENPLPWDQRLTLEHLRREAEMLILSNAG